MAKTITEMLDAAQTGEDFAEVLSGMFEGLSPEELDEGE
ncbi:hypothetical protein PBI_CHE12_62 [Mycobacterium phage Che12]|uniref:Uncharacterized protein n=1 Tax=Mycobacterium phage Che12 TaxID=2911435 RepID=Q1A0F5_9CAUD|nr:gp62 [Mycobacterium phage Che12]ABE67381.1 hypothetical protein PBI_CHE12_62 [Mycobacterium phage Che12]